MTAIPSTAQPSAPAAIPSAAGEGSPAQAQDYLFGRSRTFRTFALLCLLMVFDFADRMILAALVPAIKAEWQISDATAGLLSSVLTLGMVVFAFPAAIAIDRWSRVKTASLMGVVWGLAFAAGALTQNVGQLLLSRAVVGVGEAGYAPASYAWISAAFPKRRRQLALGLFSAAQPVGMAIGVALGGWIATRWGWRHALGVVALPGLLIAFWLYRGQDYKNIPARRAQHLPGTPDAAELPPRRSILGIPSLLLSYLSGGLSTLQWVPVVFFLPTYLNRVHAVPVPAASLLTSGAMLLSIVGIPLGGWLMDRWNRRDEEAKLVWPVIASAIATTLYAVAFGRAGNDVATTYVLIVVAFFIGSTGGTGPLTMSLELVHPAIRAFSGTCAVVAIHFIGSVPGPYLTGLLSDRYGLDRALTVLPVVSGVLAIASLLLARRHYRRDLGRVAHYPLEAA